VLLYATVYAATALVPCPGIPEGTADAPRWPVLEIYATCWSQHEHKMSAESANKLVQEEIACEYENALAARSKHHNMLSGPMVDSVKRQNIQICDVMVHVDHDHIVHFGHICT